jgi:hypothetical protein
MPICLLEDDVSYFIDQINYDVFASSKPKFDYVAFCVICSM